jgi:hypothetical protein
MQSVTFGRAHVYPIFSVFNLNAIFISSSYIYPIGCAVTAGRVVLHAEDGSVVVGAHEPTGHLRGSAHVDSIIAGITYFNPIVAGAVYVNPIIARAGDENTVLGNSWRIETI